MNDLNYLFNVLHSFSSSRLFFFINLSSIIATQSFAGEIIEDTNYDSYFMLSQTKLLERDDLRHYVIQLVVIIFSGGICLLTFEWLSTA